MKILVIEDDREAARYLEKAFAEAGHSADIAGDGETGYALAENGNYDVLVVDRMLPKRDGLSVVVGLRAKGMETPVLILSALGEVDDRVTGLRAGGDDYLTKPMLFPNFWRVSRSCSAAQARARRIRSTASAIWSLTALRILRAARVLILRFNRENFVFSNISCAMPGRSSPAPCCLKTSGITTSTRRPM